MGIFTRVRDIIGANLSAILDKAEDPEKLVRYMIQEMEDTLVEVKSSCAQSMAQVAKVERELTTAAEREEAWDSRARMAVDKGRDDLAREALMEKRTFARARDALEVERRLAQEHVDQYKDDITKLEEKLEAAREKQRTLAARHVRAANGKKVRENIRRYDAADAMVRFEHFEQRVERMEAEAELAGPLANTGRDKDREAAFARLEHDDEIEAELARLKTPEDDK